MIEIIYGAMITLIVLFLFSIYRLMFRKQQEDTLGTWKVGLFIVILSTLAFFLYFTLTIGLVGVEQTIDIGGELISVTNNSYNQLFALMPLISAIYFMQWVFFGIEVLMGMQFFGRSRMEIR